MTKKMKFKAELERGDKQEQLARFGVSFVFVRQLPICLLEKDMFIPFSDELDYFVASARRINCDIHGKKDECLAVNARMSVPSRAERRAVSHNSIF
jgi:hypothetical protein